MCLQVAGKHCGKLADFCQAMYDTDKVLYYISFFANVENNVHVEMCKILNRQNSVFCYQTSCNGCK